MGEEGSGGGGGGREGEEGEGGVICQYCGQTVKSTRVSWRCEDKA